MKNKILYQLLTILLIVSALLFSCQKPQEAPVSSNPNDKSLLSVIESYFAFSTTKVDGTFMFESNLTNNDPNTKNTALAGGVFYDKSGNTLMGGGPVSIGNRQLILNSSGTYGFDKAYSTDEFFGKKIVFTLSPPPVNGSTRASGATTVTDSLYSPAAIYITNIPALTPLVIQPGSSTPITWNTDPNDSNGVIIVAEYLPTLYANRTALSKGYSTFLTNSVLVPDNGSTSLPWSFFSSYPVGAQIILWVARGNYTILQDGSYNYKVGGYTAAAVWDVTVPDPPPVIITSTNSTADVGFTVTYTNTSTSEQTVFAIPDNGGIVGTLVPGTYNVIMSKNDNTIYRYFYSVCDQTKLAVSGNFSNITISSSCNTISIDPH